MIICHCKVVRCSEVRECVKDGETTLSKVSRRTCAGTECGRCVSLLKKVIKKSLLDLGSIDL